MEEDEEHRLADIEGRTMSHTFFMRCPMQHRFLKRLRKKAKKGRRGWPAATIRESGPNRAHVSPNSLWSVPIGKAGLGSVFAFVDDTSEWPSRGTLRLFSRLLKAQTAAAITEAVSSCEQHRGS